MFFVQCKNGCGRFLPTKGNRPTLKACGVSFCAYKAWVPLAEKHGLEDFHEW